MLPADHRVGGNSAVGRLAIAPPPAPRATAAVDAVTPAAVVGAARPSASSGACS